MLQEHRVVAGCSATDTSSELDISETAAATVTRVTCSREHVFR
ncbi:hypothetical protein ACFXKY_17005 [Streptomyces canus]